MSKKPLMKMKIEDRAKQFMPFAGVPGLFEAIRKKDIKHEKAMAERELNSETACEVTCEAEAICDDEITCEDENPCYSAYETICRIPHSRGSSSQT